MDETVHEDDANLQKALLSNELVYYYQPKVSLLSGEICGAEALIRWVRPDGNIFLPESFIPAAEASGFISELSLAMFDKLLSDIAIIEELGSNLVISFNLTAKDFIRNDLVVKLIDAVSASLINPRELQIELTETSLLDCSDVIQNNIQKIVDLGVVLAMDDFGKGYSTIDVLSKWPFSVVKVDQGLVSRMQFDEKSSTIVRNSIQLAHELGLKIIAEGVETEEVYEFLLKAGCSEVQGFLLGKPMPLDEFLAFLKANRRWTGSPIGLIHMAQVDHQQWCRSVIDYTIGKIYGEPNFAKQHMIEIGTKPYRCLLDEWYYGVGRCYSGYPAYDALEQPHNHLHFLADEIRVAIDQRRPRREVIDLLRELNDFSAEIIMLLQKLEFDVLLDRGETFLKDSLHGMP